MDTENVPNNRLAAYKHGSKSNTELRQKRHEVTVELRKNKKEDQLLKRRNITEDDGPTSPLQENNAQSPVALKFEEIMQFIRSGNPEKELAAVQAARKMLSREKNPPIDKIIGLGMVPVCVKYLSASDRPALQFEAAWALTNIASGTSEQTKVVIEANAIPRFIELLRSPSVTVAEQAVWALGNIAGDGSKARDIVLEHNSVDAIIALVSSGNTQISFLRNIVWLMSNLCRNKNPAPPFNRIEPMIPVLSALLDHEDAQVLSDACWALSYVTDDDVVKLDSVVASGAVPKLVRLLGTNNPAIITPALRSVGNIVTGNDTQTDAVIAANALTLLTNLLRHTKNTIVKEAAWTVSNITAGNQSQIQHVLDSGIFNVLIDVLTNGDFKSQKEAAWAVTNTTTGGSTEQIIQLVEKYPIMKPYCDLLEAKETRTVRVVLSGVANIFQIAAQIGGIENLCTLFEEIGALDKLETLQNHENEDIYQKALLLIETYFCDAEDVNPECAPKEVNGALEFNPTTPQDGGFSF
ncbi:importin subunit alpha [Anopheles moucheti]|uniref:importin subunit alpha n=1 Tax=Anopheles moucheti TaxID=186751 RepID=UPI0022F03D73|nr:importin subunit alpha [Anopheles moucheti]